MEAVILAILAYSSWAFGDLTSFFLARKMDPLKVTAISFALRLGLYSLLIPFFAASFHTLQITDILIILCLGCVTATGYICYFYASRLTHPALVGAIAGAWGAPSLLFAIAFLHETISLQQTLAILLIFSGFVLTTMQFDVFKTHAIKINKGVLFAFVTLLLWGIYGCFISIPIHHTGWFWSIYFTMVPFALASVFIGRRKRGQEGTNSLMVKKDVFTLILYAILIAIGEVCYNGGLGKGLVAVVAPISGSYATLLVVLAFIFFKEKISRIQIAGIIITLIGIVSLSILSA